MRLSEHDNKEYTHWQNIENISLDTLMSYKGKNDTYIFTKLVNPLFAVIVNYAGNTNLHNESKFKFSIGGDKIC